MRHSPWRKNGAAEYSVLLSLSPDRNPWFFLYFPIPVTIMAHRLLLVYLTTAAAICYYPNGNSDENPLNGRCVSLDGQESACCAINRANPSGASADATADLCKKNGLCKNIKTELQNGRNVTLTSYWRGLCSTPEWPEANCVDVCSSGSVC